jgi:membrane protein implicated in regulation of membrane protease activity
LPDLPLAWLCAALLFLGLGVALGLAASRWARVRRGRIEQQRGQDGERRAERLLRRLGYDVRARQVPGSYRLEVDGQALKVEVVADLLVAHKGRVLVAEVKRGPQAPRVGFADTRRQLLEYQLAFGVPSVLLVDVDNERVREVRFPIATPSKGRVPYALLAYLGLGALIAWAFVSRRS